MVESLLMAAAPSFARGLGESLGGGSAPSSSGTGGYSSFDSSGWNVNLGSGSIDSTRSGAGTFDQYLPYALVAVGLVVAWRLTRKR